MQRLRSLGTFLIHYWKFSLSVLAIIAGLVLQLLDLQLAANLVLGITAGLATLPLAKSMWDDVRSGTYGIDILALTAIIASIILGEFWAAIVIVVMYTGGEALEHYAEHRARSELDALLTKVPQKATVERHRKTLTIPARQVVVNDVVIIKPGEVVPVDGVIKEGGASFDESAITGESMPQPKKTGDTLLSGSINLDGAVTIRCSHIAADSQYEQIVKLVQGASNSQAPFVRLADRYSIPFTVTAYIIAIAAWIIGGDPIRFLQVIVVATPCPLLLAAPIAIISGMSRAARHGIIVKTGGALERLAQAKTIAFDKTGTLTEGRLRVEHITTFGKYRKDDVLQLAASLEQKSNHVLATAVTDKALSRNIKLTKAKHVKEHAGHGLEAQLGGSRILVGRLDFLAANGVNMPSKLNPSLIRQTATYVASDDALVGCITFRDTVRTESKSTIGRLRELGISNIMMITGDHKSSAATVAKQLGIRQGEITAQALPADKLHAIEKLHDRPVVFVGDGVNDAPVLTASEVGIALGARGSTVASESADMVILHDDVSRVATAVDIAKYTFRIARQSILIGIGLSLILMLVFATGRFNPLTGALLQEVIDVVVIINALRAHRAITAGQQSTETEPIPA